MCQRGITVISLILSYFVLYCSHSIVILLCFLLYNAVLYEFYITRTCEEKKFKCNFALNQDIPNKCILELTNLIGLKHNSASYLRKVKTPFQKEHILIHNAHFYFKQHGQNPLNNKTCAGNEQSLAHLSYHCMLLLQYIINLGMHQQEKKPKPSLFLAEDGMSFSGKLDSTGSVLRSV